MKLKKGPKVDNLPHAPNKFWIWQQGPSGYIGSGGWKAIKGPFDSKEGAEKALKNLNSEPDR